MKLTEPRLIKVTQDHIDRGECSMPSICALALAIHDVVNPGPLLDARYSVSVGTDDVLYTDYTNMEKKRVSLPLIARQFVALFDSNSSLSKAMIKPFEFMVQVPFDV